MYLYLGEPPINVQIWPRGQSTVMEGEVASFDVYWSGGTDMQFIVEFDDGETYEWDYIVRIIVLEAANVSEKPRINVFCVIDGRTHGRVWIA